MRTSKPIRSWIKGWGVSLVAISLGGFANAQPNSQPDGQSQGDENAALPPELSAQQDVQLTPEQMSKDASQHIARMDQSARGVRQQLTLARQERDVVKVLCLNDKLNQINVALASANDRQRALEAMIQGKNIDGAKHEHTIIVVLRSRVDTLVAEANQCIGEELGYLGETAVSIDIDPEIPDTDPADFPQEPIIPGGPTIISRPRVPASPG